MEAKRRGRPPVTGVTRDERIMVRLTQDEMDLLRIVANQSNLTLSEWVREVSLSFAKDVVSA